MLMYDRVVFSSYVTLILQSTEERCIKPSKKSENKDWYLIVFAVFMFSYRLGLILISE